MAKNTFVFCPEIDLMSQKDIYSPLNISAFFMMQRRQRVFRKVLRKNLSKPVKEVKLLEVGCGAGQWMTEFQVFGMQSGNFAGIELDERRTEIARAKIPEADIRCGNAVELPWTDNSFDIVFQSTVFTSVLDDDTKSSIASEMKRVCREDGFILWYDFIYNNPKNSNVKGIGIAEVKKLFSPWNCTFERVTLAPPISRRLVPLSWLAAEVTETFCPFLRTHIVAVITPN
jgi:ubiquinone/menaquinone biosynthesis C-methylase UbiE